MASRGPHNDAITWLPHTRVAWGGTLGSQGEVWTNSLRYHGNDNAVLTPEMAAAAGPTVWAALKTWVQSSSCGITPQAKLTWLKINHVNAAGLQDAGSPTNYYSEAPAAGTAGTAATYVPLYQTFALSLRGPTARGRAHIGRIFPPTTVASMTIDGRASATDTTNMALSFGTCIQAMQIAMRTALANVGSFAIFSPGNTVKGTVPIYGNIVSVECDSVPDVQHRRTNKLVRAIGTVQPILA